MKSNKENYEPGIDQDTQIQKKQKKRILVCVNCQMTLSNRTRCPQCGAKFHDGFIMKWLKKIWKVKTR